jgi:hypothetical protein
MIFMRILPGVLKELLKHVPTVLFEAVEWKVLASELPKLSRRIIQKEGYAELFELQKPFLRPFKVNLVSQVDKESILRDPKLASERILTLYFAQLFSPHGLFLDLSPHHFEVMSDNDVLNFKPSSVWTKFSPEFSQGLKEIYDGFYFEDDLLFHKGLIKSGLTSATWPESDRQHLAELFRGHFGASLTTEMSFDLETFKESFFKIADFMLNKKVNISTDFLYLGIALVTMYASLEKCGVRVNVKEIFIRVKNQLSPQ